MNQILIRHPSDVSEEEALRYAYFAWKGTQWRTGIIAFRNDIVVEYSDRSKYPSMTVFRDKQDNGLKATKVIMEEWK